MFYNSFYPYFTVCYILWPTAASLSIGPPTGPFGTTLSTIELVDHSRLDPFIHSPTLRALMVSIFEPVPRSSCPPALFPYMPTITAEFEDASYSQYGLPNNTFSSLFLQGCQMPAEYIYYPLEHIEQLDYPLVLFSPALGTSRLLYNVIAQQLSSYGYVVVTIDHPHDADIVTFPDNRTVLATNISTEEQILMALDTRASDILFVLNQFEERKEGNTPLSSYAVDNTKVALFGHSLGGAATATAMLKDHRFVGGMNLDGTFFGPVISRGLARPFMLFAHEGKNGTNDPSWSAIWPNLKGWKRDLMLSDSAHYTFSDFPFLIHVLGIAAELPAEVRELVGTIDGKRDLQILGNYISAFFAFVLSGREQSLLEGANPEFPEVSFVTP